VSPPPPPPSSFFLIVQLTLLYILSRVRAFVCVCVCVRLRLLLAPFKMPQNKKMNLCGLLAIFRSMINFRI
jgi:hypothetical protein